MICDYYVVRRRQLALGDLYRRGGTYEYSRGFNPRALIALASGVGIALLGLASPAVHWLYDYAWFVGFFVSAAIYFLLMRNAVPTVELDAARESA